MWRIVSLALAWLLAILPAPPVVAWIGQKATATASSQVLMGYSPTANSADRYAPLNFGTNTQATYADFTKFPVAGTISSLRAHTHVALTGSITIAVTLYVNGVSQAMTCTLNVSNQACSDTSHSVSVSAGDSAAFLYHTTGSPGTNVVSTSTVFTPTTSGDTILGSFALAGFSTSAAQSESIANYLVNNQQTSNGFPDGGTIDKFYVSSQDPTPGSYAYAVRLNAVTQSLAATINSGSTSANDTSHSFSVTGASGSTAGSSVQFIATPSSSPASAALASMGVRYLPTTTNAFAIMSSGPQSTDSTSADRFFYLTNAANGGPQTTESSVTQIANSMTITKFAAMLSGNAGAAASGKQRVMTIRKGATAGAMSDTAATCTISEATNTCVWTGTLTVNDGDILSIKNSPVNTPNATSSWYSILATR